jgi:molybdopterin/thiamine biosynthesis adenylyltransferase
VSPSLEESARAAVDRTLKGVGFRQVGLERGAPVYAGDVRSGRRSIPIKLILTDVLFTVPPTVRITDPAAAAQIPAHLDEAGEFCFVTRQLEEYDPYNAGGAVLRCLESVRETLDLVLHSNPQVDLEREFLSYWRADKSLYADLPHNFSGDADIRRSQGFAGGFDLLVAPAQLAPWRPNLSDTSLVSAVVLRAVRPFVCAPDQFADGSLATFREWLAGFIPAQGLKTVASAAEADRVLVVLADNGSIACRFLMPPLQQVAFAKAPAARRKAWIARHASDMTLVRFEIRPLDRSTLVNARLREPSTLEARSVSIVGCGAVGSRVVMDMVRSGAGAAGKPLILIDPDQLEAENLGRHILGVDAIGKPKVAAMAAEARRFHPAVDVQPIESDVLRCLHRIERCDLIIDATGHNPLALRLNAYATERRLGGGSFPPILHAAVHGNGLAVQTILVTASEHACLKCLRPGHGVFKADPIRPGQVTQTVPAACGDRAYIPYAAAAPAMAAALAVQAALEWSARPDAPGPRVRTRRLDLEKTVDIRDKSWGPDPACPACRKRPMDD